MYFPIAWTKDDEEANDCVYCELGGKYDAARRSKEVTSETGESKE
jgi:hypothetical protein